MRCIFCKNPSDNSKSVEHIIPESLGNKDHVLTKGIVCDTCNQYFATKIEKTVLEFPYFKHIRHLNEIENKKGNIPLIQGIIGGSIDVGRENGEIFLNIENPKTIEGIQSGRIKHMIVPTYNEPPANDINISRFIAKIAVEVIVLQVATNDELIEEFINDPEMEVIRNYARYGNKPVYWEYHQRRIYNESDRFIDANVSNEPYEILHEFEFMPSKQGDIFFVLVIMGIEYVISITNPLIDGYKTWLMENGQRSPVERAYEKRVAGKADNWIDKRLHFIKKQ